MTNPASKEPSADGVVGNLLLCPFCGGGETLMSEQHLSPTMRGPGALVSVTIRHWCERMPGIVGGGLEFRGRDHDSAISAWNRRTPAAPTGPLSEMSNADETEERK